MITLFTYVFYYMSIPFIVYKLVSLIEFEKEHQFRLYAREDIMTENPSERTMFYGYLIISYLIWLFIGLFTSQWFLFIILIVVTFLVQSEKKLYLYIKYFVQLCLIVFIVLNKIYFNI
jgi:hypothetical protein